MGVSKWGRREEERLSIKDESPIYVGENFNLRTFE